MSYGLELGSRHGGLSLFFTSRYGANIVCSDLSSPSEKARQLHRENKVAEQVTYASVDATAIPYPGETFDFVVFKSMLGAAGAHNRVDKIEQVMGEIHRVLKPGGVLFFAENLRGSLLHYLARRFFIAWGKSWRYSSLEELERYLSGFEGCSVYATGFFAAFVPKPEWLKNTVARLDQHLFFLPSNWRYVGYGHAIKKH